MKLISTIFSSVMLVVGILAHAHHGVSSEIDLSEYSLVQGVTKYIEWINPHVVIHLNVNPGTELEKEWIIFADSPSDLLDRGISSQILEDLSNYQFKVYHYESFRCSEKCMGWGSEMVDSFGNVQILASDLDAELKALTL